MKTKDLVLITTHLTTADLVGAKGLHFRENTKDLISRAKNFGLNVVVVLGAAGDEVLRALPELEDCDLTFDFNFTGEIFSSIHSGVHATSGAAFILPVDCEPLPDKAWQALDYAMWSTPPNQTDVYQYIKNHAADRVPVYPQLITLAGIKRLQKLPVTTQWPHDPKIQVQLVYETEQSVPVTPEN